ncbi:uncharacterized protein BP5553_01674 [Venustampulla echinocandica]|uniref:SIMPL domain-containing protein n=1 Tax=Venustampulla echinocandica TaxID=2656787 RepID=A0A370U1Q6_9HELO|nr:uncharacterized protein BP5553_01674 [Venustampulla echinocandica]RDL41695.1 hypothetical protein BP5553_01674 [Venustampulla echinocandica]
MTRFEMTLNGTGTAIHVAERAILFLHAQSEQLPTPAEASAAATASANALRDMIAPYCPQDEATGHTVPGAAVSHYSMTTLDTSSHQHRSKTGSLTVLYSARAEFSIKFHDFAILNKIATRASAMEHVKVSRVDWALTDETSDAIKGGARKRAAEDAIQRAWDYAEVFGKIPPAELEARVLPVRVTEQSFYSKSTRPQLHYGKGMRGSKTGREELQFEPEDVKLEATVTANFVVEI